MKTESKKFDEDGNPIFEETTDVIKTVEFEQKKRSRNDSDEYEGDDEEEPLLQEDERKNTKKRNFNYLRNLMGLNDIRQSASIEESVFKKIRN